MYNYAAIIIGNYFWSKLTHWGRVTHICVGFLTNIGSDNGLSPVRRQAIIWTNAGLSSIAPLGTNFRKIFAEIITFLFKEMYLKVSSAKWRPLCLGLNVFMIHINLPIYLLYSHVCHLQHLHCHIVQYWTSRNTHTACIVFSYLFWVSFLLAWIYRYYVMISNHAHCFLGDVITHSCFVFNGGLANPMEDMDMDEYLHIIAVYRCK